MLKLCNLTLKNQDFESSLIALTHDELRARTAFFKEKIKMNRAGIDAKIAALKVEVEGIEDIDKEKSSMKKWTL
jgi:preprotein translocase subunit SecA